MSEVNEYYYREVIFPLAKDVYETELARQSLQHQKVSKVYRDWTEPGKLDELLVQLEVRSIGSDLTIEKDLIRVGLAGLGRIRHVDANSRLRTSPIDFHSFILDDINQVGRLYSRLEVDSLPHFSIHGGPVYWPLEIDQDQASTDIILGDLEGADGILHRAMDQGIAVCRELKPIVDLETDDDILRTENYSAYKDRKSYLGALSAVGVIQARLARADHNLVLLLEATEHTYESHRFGPNPHRVSTLCWWLLAASINPHFHANLIQRGVGLIFGSARLAQMVGVDSNAVLSSLNQMRKENKG